MKNKVKTALIGIITGFANGLFGSGGGTIAVPCMEKFLGVDAHKSHATAIAVILPLSVLLLALIGLAQAVSYPSTVALGQSFVPQHLGMASGLSFGVGETIAVSIGGIIGGVVGAKLLNKISSRKIHIIFGLAMLAAAVRMFL